MRVVSVNTTAFYNISNLLTSWFGFISFDNDFYIEHTGLSFPTGFAMNQQLIDLIHQTQFLSVGDKDFLMEKIPAMTSLEKLKLQTQLQRGEAPAILQSLQILRGKFFESETPKKPDIITKTFQKIFPQPKPRPVSVSVLTQEAITGTPPAQQIMTGKAPVLGSLADFSMLEQLTQITAGHVTFDLNQNIEQNIHTFLAKLDQLFGAVDDLVMRRNYYMNFVQSALFKSYLHTGITSFRHPELEPRKIALNLLYQINTNYLNNQQFRQAAIISSHIRRLAVL
jgi:hypothetical protein